MIEIKGLCKSYGKKVILDGISFHADRGEQIAIVGDNGAGKTTLLRIMAGILKADSGEIEYFGHDMMCAKERAHITKYCGYLPQTDPLIPELSVQDNIDLWTGSLGRPDEKLVKMFELDDILRTRAGQLSGGMKRRVSIACAVSLWPLILLMDEPTASLDSGHRESVHKLMEDYRKLDGTIVIATHDEEEIRMSDKCYRIDR